jgi:hypothetical protein
MLCRRQRRRRMPLRCQQLACASVKLGSRQVEARQPGRRHLCMRLLLCAAVAAQLERDLYRSTLLARQLLQALRCRQGVKHLQPQRQA